MIKENSKKEWCDSVIDDEVGFMIEEIEMNIWCVFKKMIKLFEIFDNFW